MTDFMQMALELAQRAALEGEVPVGAVLVQNNQVIASAYNQVETRTDASAHAELLVISQASQRLHQRHLLDCDLYVTLEPCPMCAHAISLARLRRLYFGAYDPKSGGVEHGPRIFSQPTCHHAPEVIGGLQEHACGILLTNFFAERRA